MAVTTREAVDVSAALATALEDVGGLRVEWGPMDKARPPCCVLSLPTLTFNDETSGFCWALWDYSLALVTARNQDVAAQQELSRLVRDVANALNHQDVEGLSDVSVLDARPTTVAISGQELPAYLVRVQVRA